MRYDSGDILYYVCPFVFEIDKVRIDMAVQEPDGIYYIDHSGAYLREDTLHKTLKEAKVDALNRLNHFYHKQQMYISSIKEKHLKINNVD